MIPKLKLSGVFTPVIARVITCLFSFSLFISLSMPALSQRISDTTRIKYSHEMTPEEELLRGLIGLDFVTTPPPDGPARNVAEFEKMQSVLIRYPFGISYAIIREMSLDINVLTIVASTSEQNTVLNNYISNGVNTANCSFLIAPTNSYWTRDYGPWFIYDGNDQPGIVDFPYNRPRPLDDEIPVEVADYLGINLFGMDVTHTGGNYMTDGMGISSSSELVWDENASLTHAEIAQAFEDYLGISNYIVVPDPNISSTIDHIDCWGKFLDVDKVLIRQTSTSDPEYDELEATAAYYASQISSYGVPYQVFRVYTPNDEPYSNSLILNTKVLVPITGSQWDDEAIATYQEAMPGYEVLGFSGSWLSTDALHCRAKGIADIGMLYIKHIPLIGNQPVLDEYPIQTEITAYSGQTIYPDSVFIIYSVDFGEWDTLPMTNISGKIYSGAIPSQTEGSQVEYYLYAADQSGRNATHPFIGRPDPHLFIIGIPLYPNITVNPASFKISVPVGGSASDTLSIENSGGMFLNFNAGISYNAKGKSSSTAYPLNSNYNTGTTSSSTKSEVSLAKANPPTTSGWMKFDVSGIPDGSVINSIVFHGYVYANNWPYWSITPVSNDPVAATASVLYSDINAEANSGYYLHREESGTLSAGYITSTLGGTANTDLHNALSQDWFAVGIADTDAGTYYIDFQGWNETNRPYLVIDYTYVPPYTWLTLDGSSTTNGSIEGQNVQNVIIGFDASELAEGTYTADITLSNNDPDMPTVIIPVVLTVVPHLFVDLKVFLEGPYNGSNLNTNLTGLNEFPLTQPYQSLPWNYAGDESVSVIPPDIVDWILVEYRDAASSATATASTVKGRQAAFLRSDGSVVALDGVSDLQHEIAITQQLFVVIYHRNHLAVMSAEPLVMAGGIYHYDYSDGESKVFGGSSGHKEIISGIWAMAGGDCNADGLINLSDLSDIWLNEAGLSGYLMSDPNMNTQSDNQDKNELIIKNLNFSSQVP
jgi:agmatine deiminase